MASYAELVDLDTNSGLRDKVKIALEIKAVSLLTGSPPSADQIAWASKSFSDPVSLADDIVRYVIAANNTASVANIVGVSDAAIQANVDAAVDKLLIGGGA